MDEKSALKLIVTIVDNGNAEKVVEITKEMGAGGGTIFFARGTGRNDHVKLFGLTVEPEKEVVLTLIEKCGSEKILSAITEGLELEQPGKGIAFVLDVSQVAGCFPREE